MCNRRNRQVKMCMLFLNSSPPYSKYINARFIGLIIGYTNPVKRSKEHSHCSDAETRPEPTVCPPSRIRLGEPCLTDDVFSRFSVITFSENIDLICTIKLVFITSLYISLMFYPKNLYHLMHIVLHSYSPRFQTTKLLLLTDLHIA